MVRRRNPLAEVFFLGIPTLLFVFVMLIPLMMSVFYSFTDWDGISKSYGFVGAENYARIFTTDTDFLDAFLFTAAMSAVTTVLTVLLGIILAAALSGGMRGRNILRLAFFLPNTLGGVVLGYVWKFILLIGPWFPVVSHKQNTLVPVIFKMAQSIYGLCHTVDEHCRFRKRRHPFITVEKCNRNISQQRIDLIQLITRTLKIDQNL